MSSRVGRERYSFGNLDEVLELPDLVSIQKDSFQRFLDVGLAETFSDISPISDFGGHLQLVFSFDPYDEDLRTAAQVLRGGVQGTRHDLLGADLRARRVQERSHRRGQGPDRVHGRLPDDDPQGHVHHQRHRAGGGEPARAFTRCHLPARRAVPPPEHVASTSWSPATIHPYRGEWIEFDVEHKPGKDPPPAAGWPASGASASSRCFGRSATTKRTPSRPPRAFVEHFDFLEAPVGKGPRHCFRHPARGPARDLQAGASLVSRPLARLGHARNYFRNAFFESRATTSAVWAATSSTASSGPELDRSRGALRPGRLHGARPSRRLDQPGVLRHDPDSEVLAAPAT